MVVSTVLDYACTGGNVELIAADTDLLIMPLYVCNITIREKTINSEAKKNHKAIKCDIVHCKTYQRCQKIFDFGSYFRWM